MFYRLNESHQVELSCGAGYCLVIGDSVETETKYDIDLCDNCVEIEWAVCTGYSAVHERWLLPLRVFLWNLFGAQG